jgi:AraC-like DNA-binding protein
MLTETDMPLDTVAAHVGMASRSHLHRECVKLLGMSPGAYREDNRKVGE